jgi:hypothetical protein
MIKIRIEDEELKQNKLYVLSNAMIDWTVPPVLIMDAMNMVSDVLMGFFQQRLEEKLKSTNTKTKVVVEPIFSPTKAIITMATKKPAPKGGKKAAPFGGKQAAPFAKKATKKGGK